MIEPFSYKTPKGYECSSCRSSNCKLWRQYQTFANEIQLLCGPCALTDQHREGKIGADGKVSSGGLMRTDSIGSLVPAVPTEDGKTFWGYTSVPDDGVAWWKVLPSYPETKP